MGRSWDEVINDRASLKDIDREAIDYFIDKGIEAERVPDDLRKASTEEVLTSLGLVDESGGLTNAAVLLFGKKPQQYYPSAVFKIGRFGIDEADLMFQDVIEGNLIQMADRIMDALKAKYLISHVQAWSDQHHSGPPCRVASMGLAAQHPLCGGQEAA